MKTLTLLLPLIGFIGVSSVTVTKPTVLGKFRYPHAAFSAVYPRKNSSGYDLLLSSFGVIGADVSIVEDIGKYLKDLSQTKVRSLTKSLHWPNEVAGVPGQVFFDKSRWVAIPDGFLVPTKGDGALKLYELDVANPRFVTISSGSGQWYYHRVEWIDMNKDGSLDAVTCRAHSNIFGQTNGQLVWFTNPTGHSVDKPWKENILGDGPGVFFKMTNLSTTDGVKEVIVAAQFFGEKLSIYWTEDPLQDWTKTNMVKSRVIDDSIGKPFDVVFAYDFYNMKPDMVVTTNSASNGTVLIYEIPDDFSRVIDDSIGKPFDVLFVQDFVNMKMDLVVTTNSATNGTILIYEIPPDFRTGTFKRHLVADGIKSKSFGLNKGGPGSAYLVPTTKSFKGTARPSVLVSGDDAAFLKLVSPKNPASRSDWTYENVDFLTTGSSTVGGISYADIDGDGLAELFVPSYDEGYVYVLRF